MKSKNAHMWVGVGVGAPPPNGFSNLSLREHKTCPEFHTLRECKCNPREKFTLSMAFSTVTQRVFIFMHGSHLIG